MQVSDALCHIENALRSSPQQQCTTKRPYARSIIHRFKMSSDNNFPTTSSSFSCQPTINILPGEDSFLDPSASITCSYSQQQESESSGSGLGDVNITYVELTIGKGAIFHPHSKFHIILPQAYRSSTIRIALGNYNLFGEQCFIEIDTTHYFVVADLKDDIHSIIGNYNTFGPKCCVRGLQYIGDDNIFESKSCITSGIDSLCDDLSKHHTMRPPRIENGCIFTPMVQFRLTDCLDHNSTGIEPAAVKLITYDHLVVFLLDGTVQVQSCAHIKANQALTDSKRNELESMCTSIRTLLEQNTKI